MSKKQFNYGKQFKPAEASSSIQNVDDPNLKAQQEEKVVAPTVEEETDEVDTTEVTPNKQPLKGIVTGCVKLNVRKGPNKGMPSVSIINESDEVTITDTLTGWYKVTTKEGIVGFCMGQFIEIK